MNLALARSGASLVALAPFAYRCNAQGLEQGLEQGLLSTVAAAVLSCWVVTTHPAFDARSRWARGGIVPSVVLAAGTASTRPALGVLAAVLIVWVLQFDPEAPWRRPGERPSAVATIFGVVALVGATVVLVSRLLVLGPALVVLASVIVAEVYRRLRPAIACRLDDALAARAGMVTHRAEALFTRLAVGRRLDEVGRRLGTWNGRRLAAPSRVRTLWVGLTLAALVVALRDVRVVLFDDAAITFRFAARIATGRGFTYNDGDRTNGASAPLYTLLLAGFRWLGADLETTAKAVGVAAYAAVTGLVVRISGRVAGPVAALSTGVLLLVSWEFRTQSLSGMESVFAALLGLVCIAFWLEGRDVVAGVVLGLAVVNKLDAALLGVAVVGTSLIVLRRPPWRLGLVALATALPWLVFSQLYFGSALPYSATQKLSTAVGDPASGYAPGWIIRSFDQKGDAVLLRLALLAGFMVVGTVVGRRARDRTDLALVAAWLWGALHFAVFSLVDLGDPYPWYPTVIYPAAALAGGVLIARFAAVVFAHGRRRSVWLGSGAVVVCLVFMVATAGGRLREVAAQVRDGHQVDDYESFEATRREAGRYLGEHARPGEVVSTCFGWIAYGALDSPIKEVCPLSTRLAVDRPRYDVVISWPGRGMGRFPAGSERLATFVSHVGPGGESTVVRCADLPQELEAQRVWMTTCDAPG